MQMIMICIYIINKFIDNASHLNYPAINQLSLYPLNFAKNRVFSMTDDLVAVSQSTVATQQLQSLIEAGGPVIVLLVLMSIVACTVFLVKLTQFIGLGFNRHSVINRALQHWHSREPEQAISTLKKTRNPIAQVLETAILLRSQQDAKDEKVREETLRIAKQQLTGARSHLRILEVIATLSPLLGLLGTVLGMIEAFQKLEGSATVDPAILSGGIWEALLTTAAGLVVAIPTVMALNWLEQSIEQFKHTMEDAMTQVFTTELIKPTPATPTSPHNHVALAN